MRPAILVALLPLIGSPALGQQPASGDSGVTEASGSGPADEKGGETVPVGPDGQIVFRSIIGDKPLDLDERPAEEMTEAVTEFRRTGENPHSGDEEAIAEGKLLYSRLCQACHLPSGTGRIGPSLADEQWRHQRLETEVGRFEIIYGGGAGAMQAFSHRIDPDEILKVMAYIDTFREPASD